MSDHVQFGCMRCKRTKRAKAMVEATKKTMESVFDTAWEMMRDEARNFDVDVPIELKAKMMKWGAKYHIFAPETETVVQDRNKLD